MTFLVVIVLLAVAVGLLSLLFRLLKAPIKLVFKLLLHTLLGFAALFIFNFVGSWTGISLGINWLNAVIVGVLGIPGVILLLLLKFFL